MKKTFLYAAAFSLLGSVAMATPVEDVVKSLTDQGATNIEVSQGETTTKVEGVVDGKKVEVTIDNETGAVVKEETDSVDGTTGSTDDGADDNDSADNNDNDGSDEGGDDDHEGSDHDGSGHEGGGSGGDND